MQERPKPRNELPPGSRRAALTRREAREFNDSGITERIDVRFIGLRIVYVCIRSTAVRGIGLRYCKDFSDRRNDLRRVAFSAIYF